MMSESAFYVPRQLLHQDSPWSSLEYRIFLVLMAWHAEASQTNTRCPLSSRVNRITASADVSNVSQFQLPDPAGRAGGACTSAILQVLYKDKHQQAESLTWVELLRRMRSVLLNMGFDQVPQLTSSRLIDVHKPMYIVPPGSNGTRRAILIGINYKGQQGQLSGCHNDASNIGEFLERVHGFSRSNMLILMDDGKNHSPTKDNIINAFKRIADYSKAGDVVFLHYSGECPSIK